MGYRHQPYRKRPSRGKLAVLVLCAALVYAGVLAGVRLVGGRLEAAEAAEPMGSLAGRFSSGELTLQYAGRALRYRERALTNVLLIGVDWTEQAQRASARYDGQADFLLLLSFDREKKTVASLQLDRDTMTPRKSWAMSTRILAATLWRAATIPTSALPQPVLWLRASATAVL